ncbi:MAG: Trp biosynthesis-associated membrane protein, partial [Candidatus Nanopelagicales bacterium]
QASYGLTGVATYSTTFWWVPATAGALAALGAGVLTAVHRGRWPGMTGRYERRPGTASTAHRPARSAERSAWDQLDAGTDPTEPAAPAAHDAGTMSASATPSSAPSPSVEATGIAAATTEEDRR